MNLIKYLSLRRSGYSMHAAVALAQDSNSGDKAVGVAVAVFFVWMLADSLSFLL